MMDENELRDRALQLQALLLNRLRAENAALKAQWESVPWDGWREATQLLRKYERIEPNASVECLADGLDDWLADYAPRPRPTTEQLNALVELIRKA